MKTTELIAALTKNLITHVQDFLEEVKDIIDDVLWDERGDDEEGPLAGPDDTKGFGL